MSLNESQLQTLKDRLVKDKAKLEAVLETLVAEDPVSNEKRRDDNADVGTEATESNELERSQSLEDSTKLMLKRIDEALQRMEQGTFGKTLEGEEIPYERLLIDPTVTTVVN